MVREAWNAQGGFMELYRTSGPAAAQTASNLRSSRHNLNSCAADDDAVRSEPKMNTAAGPENDCSDGINYRTNEVTHRTTSSV
jgi:hypothetical protein